MSITRVFYDPFSEFDRLFDDAFNSRFARPNPNQIINRDQTIQDKLNFRPKMDLHESAEHNAITATFELPGLTKENVNIDLHNGRLTVSGKVETQVAREENDFAVRERSFGNFSRTLRVSEGVKPEEIKASMENGVLTVTFPKGSADQAPKRITVS
ncbi:hypothetical protein SERLA73DRAFT_182331 [Serpula lacrymans var. lacrymans S7.3]|uniref:SHSP domain-containing protein n=2 Tax=Serpula lacrymans var. lacrymans TaxID=341189 RepID=F8PX97_SERL3|nr:uncharacterized protein SERLADRAFT_468923 [Serpula lacrymans var. lacrymans S7.9]EGN99372.1 hypothetical protein SERLA73DRAFT_182331 [Serpula lacrymans var. lacrymans S7.3]EGO24933.1 hypothetical protein SERLADRAFT_468923 [Serpula lacrymans var. lacrymans S7.9]